MLLVDNRSMNKKTYKKLIMYLLNKCNIVTFLVPENNKTIDDLVKQLEPFIIRHYMSDEYCDRITKGIYNIYMLSFEYNIIESLNLVSSLYKWIYPDLPEDLCFYRNGKCFLKSIAHEKLCFIYTDDNKEIEDLVMVGLELIEMPFEEAPILL